MVAMTDEQHADVEHYIVCLMHANERERASRMMNLALGWKFAKPPEELPSNVYPLVTHAGDNWSRRMQT